MKWEILDHEVARDDYYTFSLNDHRHYYGPNIHGKSYATIYTSDYNHVEDNDAKLMENETYKRRDTAFVTDIFLFQYKTYLMLDQWIGMD